MENAAPSVATRRSGAVAVEAAIVLPLVLVLLFGIWEVGRFVLVGQMLNTAAREGARLAAGGYTNGTPVTAGMVQQAVQDYLTAAGFPAAAVNGAPDFGGLPGGDRFGPILIRRSRSIRFRSW